MNRTYRATLTPKPWVSDVTNLDIDVQLLSMELVFVVGGMCDSSPRFIVEGTLIDLSLGGMMDAEIREITEGESVEKHADGEG